jgi:uncharacterized surface protein with fasciclin (FAS1) repeats
LETSKIFADLRIPFLAHKASLSRPIKFVFLFTNQTNKMKFLTAAAAFLASASLVAGQTIVDIAVDSSPEFETLVLAVTLVPGLAATLSGPGPFSK